MFTHIHKQGGNMKALKRRIQDAITERMEPRGYGDNPEELVKTSSGDVYVSPKELDKLVRMQKCVHINFASFCASYTEETIKEDRYYPHTFYASVYLTKKQAKKVAQDAIERFKELPDRLLKVRLYSWASFGEGKFSMSIGGE